MFAFAHQNFNVLDLEKSIEFYEKALGLHVARRNEKEHFTLVYLTDDAGKFELELTYLNDRTTPYNLGDEEFHLAFITDDMEKAHALHTEMNCICYENPEMGIYFIKDPDGYWIEIVPAK